MLPGCLNRRDAPVVGVWLKQDGAREGRRDGNVGNGRAQGHDRERADGGLDRDSTRSRQ